MGRRITVAQLFTRDDDGGHVFDGVGTALDREEGLAFLSVALADASEAQAPLVASESTTPTEAP